MCFEPLPVDCRSARVGSLHVYSSDHYGGEVHISLQSRALKAVGRAAKSDEDHSLETCGLQRAAVGASALVISE